MSNEKTGPWYILGDFTTHLFWDSDKPIYKGILNTTTFHQEYNPHITPDEDEIPHSYVGIIELNHEIRIPSFNNQYFMKSIRPFCFRHLSSDPFDTGELWLHLGDEMERKLGGVKTSWLGGQPWWIWPIPCISSTPWFRNHPFIGDSEFQTTDLVVGKTLKDGGDCISDFPPPKKCLKSFQA